MGLKPYSQNSPLESIESECIHECGQVEVAEDLRGFWSVRCDGVCKFLLGCFRRRCYELDRINEYTEVIASTTGGLEDVAVIVVDELPKNSMLDVHVGIGDL